MDGEEKKKREEEVVATSVPLSRDNGFYMGGPSMEGRWRVLRCFL